MKRVDKISSQFSGKVLVKLPLQLNRIFFKKIQETKKWIEWWDHGEIRLGGGIQAPTLAILLQIEK